MGLMASLEETFEIEMDIDDIDLSKSYIKKISEYVNKRDSEVVFKQVIRYRTLGDMTCTGAVESTASTLDEIIQEVAGATKTERGGR